ncbi:MAG: choline ABC transporter ATP-binding protein, partial [Pseudomonadota bacterium]
VGLARAFVTEAPILLMDEPFSALDPLIRTKLQDELLDLQRQLRRTLIFVSHDLDEAFKLGNKIAIMEGGRIVQAGTPQDIYRAPTNAYVADFIQHMNPLGVLRARDLMQPLSGQTEGSLPADALIKDGMDRLIGATHPIGVEEGGTLIGQLSKDDLLTGLARGSGG